MKSLISLKTIPTFSTSTYLPLLPFSIIPKNPKLLTASFVPTSLRCCAFSPPSPPPHHQMPINPLPSTLSSSSCSGEIHVIVGPMFAGKTSSLLRRIHSEVNNGRKVALIKSNKDTRYEINSIVTHDGDKYPCLALHDLSSFKQKIGSSAYDELEVIGIDEAQFFGDLYDFCRRAADHDGKTVIVAGLDGDYMRKSFGSVLDVIPLADSVTKLTARCELCGKRACFSLRKTDEKQTELIGGAEVYMPVCRQHYVSGQVVIEAARTVLQQKVQCG
ncbi:unnamed protein product [Amaranthus hypochondriacus]